MSEEVKSANGKKATRGVSYPFISLPVAIEKARAFHKEERKNAAPVAAAMKHFGYADTSGIGRQTVSALLQFGLLQDEGRKEDRQVRLTDDALTIILDLPDSPDRIRAMQRCVRSPKLYANILAKWPDEPPSDHTLSFYLQKEFDFNPKTLSAFISDFRESLAFARLDLETNTPSSEERSDNLEREKRAEPEVGNFVQWESGGVDQFEAPRKVRAKQQYEGSWWVFVDGSETGIPMDEVTVVEKPEQKATLVRTAPSMPIAPSLLHQSASELPPTQFEREWLRGPLSKDVGYRLIVSGEMGAKEIGKLIKLLEAQKLVLDDDE